MPISLKQNNGVNNKMTVHLLLEVTFSAQGTTHQMITNSISLPFHTLIQELALGYEGHRNVTSVAATVILCNMQGPMIYIQSAVPIIFSNSYSHLT